jgi:hypothetical protein
VTFDTSAAEALTRKGGGNIAKFPNIGDVVKIKITGLERQQETDYNSGLPLTYDDGKPKMQFIFHGIDQDTQEETRIFSKPRMVAAIQEALAKADSIIEVGGILAVKYTEDLPSSKPGKHPAKNFVAQYQPPKPASISADDLM